MRRGLEALSDRMSIRYLQIARASLARAIRYAEAHDLVGRNVATLIDNPQGQVGRPSRSLTLEQSLALLDAARESRLNAYIVLSLAVGIRIEEARELHWDHLDLDGDPSATRPVPPSVAVWHSVRHGGDTKTAKSRRTLALPQAAVQAQATAVRLCAPTAQNGVAAAAHVHATLALAAATAFAQSSSFRDRPSCWRTISVNAARASVSGSG